MTNLICPECKGEIKMGVAIYPNAVYGERICWVEPPLLNHETIKMIDVYKCKSCGYSCDDEYNLMKVNIGLFKMHYRPVSEKLYG